MNDLKQTTLDYIDNIVVPGAVFKNPANEYYALICLRDGMNLLYRYAKRCDDVVKSRVNPKCSLTYMSMGNLPEFQGIPKPLITCFFHWYATSACNYVRTVGKIAYLNDNSRVRPYAYVQAVIPDALAFRDKVAAHFAWTTKHKQDNNADRVVSVLPQLTFNNDSFYVAGISLALRKGGKVSKSESLTPWSICKVHENLQERYWPEQVKREIS